jgi:hypothetical protein
VNVYVVAASDAERDAERRLRWGDHWLKRGIERALAADGWQVDAAFNDSTDMLIHCFGGQFIKNLPPHTYNVLYVHSHPDMLDDTTPRLYDRVVAGSEQLAAELRARGIEATWNIGASDFVPMDVPLEHDVVFVGNNRGGMRPAIEQLGDLTELPFRLEVWGEGWESLPPGIWQGKYIPYDDLNALYASTAVVLNDTHVDMVAKGIINPRVLDALKAGAMVVTDGDFPSEPHPTTTRKGCDCELCQEDPDENYVEYDEDRRPIVGGERLEVYRGVTRPGEWLLDRVIGNQLVARIKGLLAERKRGAQPIEADWSYARLARELATVPGELVRWDLGCGKTPRRGFVGIDKAGGEGVVEWDLEHGLSLGGRYPFVVIADNIFEHINNLIPLLNDCHKVLSLAAGRLHVTVPNAIVSPEAAFSDPTHVRYFTPQTFDYFNGAHPRWQEYGQQYGILPWRVVYVRQRERFIEAMLRPA